MEVMQMILLLSVILSAVWYSALAHANGTSDETVKKFRPYFNSGSLIIPHPDKIKKGGEDALVVRDRLIGVADGVGGWNVYGVDPGKYSKRLMELVGEYHDKYPDASPKQVMIRAHCQTKEEGLCTWVIAILDDKHKKVATTLIGDSSYMIVKPRGRRSRILYRSFEQQEDFNCPYNIGLKLNKLGLRVDDPDLAVDTIHTVSHNDLIVMGSDGIFDNCFDDEILDVVKSSSNRDTGLVESPLALAEKIAKIAEDHGKDRKFRSPFGIHAEKEGHHWSGGKQDDIAIVVSQIKLNEEDDKSHRRGF